MNWILYFIFFVILITKDVLLFNEEFLILFCFTTFCILIYNNLREDANSYFLTLNSNTSSKFLKFYEKIIVLIQNEIFYKNKKFNVSNNVLNLKRYYSNFNNKLLNSILNHQIKEKQIKFEHKLNFISSLEKQFQKLIILIVLIKIKKLIVLSIFLQKKIKINSFNCTNKINLLEYIKKI